MKLNLFLSAASAIALVTAPAMAQDTLTSTSGSGAEANSGSVSGAISDQAQGQSQTALVGVSENQNTSTSNSGAVSGSESSSGSVSDQQQGQSLNNDNTNQLGAVNEQGVQLNQTWNSAQQLRRTYVGTNAAVPLAASSSFSSDYCGGTASVGASVAPIGVSIGGNKPIFDKSCQSLRRAEKFGMAAANAHNMQQPELAGRLMAMMIWSICTSDSAGAGGDESTAVACGQAGLMGGYGMPVSVPATYIAPPEPQPQVTPEYVAPNADVSPDQNWDDQPRVPRGEADDDTDPLAVIDPLVPRADNTMLAAATP